MAPRRLNLNNYEVVDNPDDATFVIVPMEINGVKQPLLYFRSIYAKKGGVVEDVENAEWKSTVKISDKGEPVDYIERINWWFASMSDDYKGLLLDTYRNLPDPPTEIRAAKAWLISNADVQTMSGTYTKRKKDIKKFLEGWLKRSIMQTPNYRRRR